MPRATLWADHPALREALFRRLSRQNIVPEGHPDQPDQPDDEAMRPLCIHCNHYWAAPHSEYCPICEVL